MCKASAEEIHVDELIALATQGIEGQPPVLVVGDSVGELSSKLAAAGFAVTSLIEERSVVEPVSGVTHVRRGLQQFEGGRFRAIVLLDALQQHDVVETIARADSLLDERGRLIIDDIDVDRFDEPTLQWFVDSMETATNDLSARTTAQSLNCLWRAKQRYGTYGLAHFQKVIGQRFEIREAKHVECMYRQIAKHLPNDRDGIETALWIRELERVQIASGDVRAVGLQMVAERAPTCAAVIDKDKRCVLALGHGGLHQWRSPDGSQSFEWG